MMKIAVVLEGFMALPLVCIKRIFELLNFLILFSFGSLILFSVLLINNSNRVNKLLIPFVTNTYAYVYVRRIFILVLFGFLELNS